jgi:glycosyltransferase involved in cell wall biosynthesis
MILTRISSLSHRRSTLKFLDYVNRFIPCRPRRTLLSLNRFEGKKNAMLALQAFAVLKIKRPDLSGIRLVLAGNVYPPFPHHVSLTENS